MVFFLLFTVVTKTLVQSGGSFVRVNAYSLL